MPIFVIAIHLKLVGKPPRRPLRARQADGDLPSCGDWFRDRNSIHALVWQHLWCSRLLQLGRVKNCVTLPETNIAPGNGWLEY